MLSAGAFKVEEGLCSLAKGERAYIVCPARRARLLPSCLTCLMVWTGCSRGGAAINDPGLSKVSHL